MKRQELAPAKVNLTLDVGAKRPDGYHEVVSVMQSVALYDTVTMESGTGEGISLTCDDAAIPADGSNLAWRAAEVFFRTTGVAAMACILPWKEYPLSGGVGRRGDAAAVCVACGSCTPRSCHGGAGTHGHGVGQ
ncbi:MAG: 4-(cytidine 5'-diphospho)-2-C-methyl-D-erythritol kinase [Oscillospiraceae bacterium]